MHVGAYIYIYIHVRAFARPAAKIPWYTLMYTLRQKIERTVNQEFSDQFL